MAQLYPLGVRTDGSFYTRIEWSSDTETDPLLWVGNAIDDDIDRNGGSWAAHSLGPVNLILSFFGEEQTFSKIRFYRNVGITGSILEELARVINVYVNDTDEPRKIRRISDSIDSVDWDLAVSVPIEKAEGWQDVVLDKPVKAKYLRFELTENQADDPKIDWTEINEIKILP